MTYVFDNEILSHEVLPFDTNVQSVTQPDFKQMPFCIVLFSWIQQPQLNPSWSDLHSHLKPGGIFLRPYQKVADVKGRRLNHSIDVGLFELSDFLHIDKSEILQTMRTPNDLQRTIKFLLIQILLRGVNLDLEQLSQWVQLLNT